ncbi:MAG: hypothetical protein NTZ54_08180 [Alphaproteobacteria bacterium]|nr:hypothetical protein [Alphaproteobacteria bacterium]
MRIWFSICIGLTVWILALPSGLMAAVLATLLVWSSLALGSAASRRLGVDEPFLEFTVGAVLQSYIGLVALTLLPDHAELILLGITTGLGVYLGWRLILGLRRGAMRSGLHWLPGLSTMLTALITFLWNYDNHSRLGVFQQSGRLDFWVDILVHAARIAQLGGTVASGRGNALLVDSPAPFYHMASYALPALVLGGSNAYPLAVATLMWIPLGTLVMTTGAVALGHALGGDKVAFWTLPALALVIMESVSVALRSPCLFSG